MVIKLKKISFVIKFTLLLLLVVVVVVAAAALHFLHCLINRQHSKNTEFRELVQSPASSKEREKLVGQTR
jgi:hypothetical protein